MTPDLRRYRKAKGFTQAQLALYLGVGQTYISDMETGRRPVPAYIIERLQSEKEWQAAVDGKEQPVESDDISTLKTENRMLREENARCWRLIEKLTKSGK